MKATSIFFLTLMLIASALSDVERLNALLVTADDLGIQLSCYGDPIARTPKIDELAARSTRFETAYVSQASCSPSRSTMFTGLYPHGNGHYGLANVNVGFQVHEELIENLLPNVLKRSGYRTGIIGKLHVNPEERFQFDLNTKEGFGQRDVRKQLQFAREFIEAEGDEPWFLMFNLFDPHVQRDRLPDGSRSAQYLPDQVQGLPETLLSADDVSPWPWQGIDTPEQRTKIAGYYNCVHRIDVAIGKLMDILEESGNRENTLIIFLGDHGPPFTRGKTSCYEAGLRVPFIVNWPGLSEPGISDRLVGSIDIYPTILDAAGIDVPAGLHGRTLRTALQGTAHDNWRDTLVAEFHYHGASPFYPRRAITDGRYKLIHNLLAGLDSLVEESYYSLAGLRPQLAQLLDGPFREPIVPAHASLLRWSRPGRDFSPLRRQGSSLPNPPSAGVWLRARKTSWSALSSWLDVRGASRCRVEVLSRA